MVAVAEEAEVVIRVAIDQAVNHLLLRVALHQLELQLDRRMLESQDQTTEAVDEAVGELGSIHTVDDRQVDIIFTSEVNLSHSRHKYSEDVHNSDSAYTQIHNFVNTQPDDEHTRMKNQSNSRRWNWREAVRKTAI